MSRSPRGSLVHFSSSGKSNVANTACVSCVCLTFKDVTGQAWTDPSAPARHFLKVGMMSESAIVFSVDTSGKVRTERKPPASVSSGAVDYSRIKNTAWKLNLANQCQNAKHASMKNNNIVNHGTIKVGYSCRNILTKIIKSEREHRFGRF